MVRFGVPPVSVAPALGWAVYSVIALPLLSLIGFSPSAVTFYAAVFIAAAFWALWHVPKSDAGKLPAWAGCIALVMGCLPLMAIMPKTVVDGVLLAPPMFDHVKIALVDGILRDGLPVPNPFYGPRDPGHLAYYYLWHFGVAQFARLLHLDGWPSEAAMTGFTAFSSVMLMMGLAVALGGRAFAVIAATLLSLPGSLRPILNGVLGDGRANAFIPRSSDIGNWLNQAAWVPQHMASATCVVVSTLLMLRLADGGWLAALLLGATVAAGFESSMWVGGIAFAVAGGLLGLWLLCVAPRRLMLVGRGLAACCLTGLLIAPFVRSELHGLAARHSGAGLMLAPYQVLGEGVPQRWLGFLDGPAFWLVFLPYAFPALVPLGVAAVLRLVRLCCAGFESCPRALTLPTASRRAPSLTRSAVEGVWHRSTLRHIRIGLRLSGTARRLALAIGITALGCLCAAWLLRSTLDNNDLGWRAVLPALLILSPAAGVELERLLRHRPRYFLAWIAIAALGVPQTFLFARDYAFGQRPGDPAGFAHSAAQWQAVRRLIAPDERIANNPRFVEAETPWPVNISWALLADRPSCYAGWETVLAYGGISRAQLIEIDARFARVFAGTPLPSDVRDLASKDHCSAAVVASTDGAWAHDPFAASEIFHLAGGGPYWRIYRRAGLNETNPVVEGARSGSATELSYHPPRPDPPSPPVPSADIR